MDFGSNLEGALLWIVLLPLAGAAINGLAGRFADRRLVGGLAVGAVAAAFALSVMAFLQLVSLRGAAGEDARLVQDVYEWFSLHLPGPDPMAQGFVDVPIRFRLVMDSLSAVMALVVTGIGLLIHVYALGYMRDDPGFARFFAYLNLFMASMLLLVLASNLPLMFVGWEGVGLCSYLLIGFWFQNADYAAAGRKAFVMNRIGDFGVLIGMFILVVATGTFEFEEINAAAPGLTGTLRFGRTEIGMVATVASLFLFLGCTGKSAQIPLFTWLPDAMAGPTPVSALIHAATMVTAGVYLCARLSPVFATSPAAMATIAVVGALTALLAASVALVQNQMKKILAYSTVSQLGFMFAAVGSGAFAAGIFHVMTHAFFKACLFLGAGAVMHAVGAHGDADVRRLGGLRKLLPATHLTFLLSCLAIAGVPLTSGFFSKDEILLGAATMAFAHGEPFYAPAIGVFVLAALGVAAAMTAYYMFRLYFLTFAGTYRSAGDAADGHDAAHAGVAHGDDGGHGYDAHPHESPATMTVPLWILGIGAIVAGFVGLPGWTHANLLLPWLDGPVATLPGHDHHELGPAAVVAMGVGVAAMALGIGAAWLAFGRGGTAEPLARVPALHRILFDRWRVDELYDATVVRPIHGLARLLAQLDGAVVDGLLARATSAAVQLGGWLLTRLQTGYLYAYGSAMAIGTLFVAWWFTFPHPSVETTVEGDLVTLVAAPGLGYEYRWDAESDGEPDTDWDPDGRRLEHVYGATRRVAWVALFDRGRNRSVEHRLVEGATIELGPDELGRRWEAPGAPDSPRRATLRVEGGRVLLRPNDAAVAVTGEIPDEDLIELVEGQVVRVGGARLELSGVVRATLEVRSAFGNVARKTVDVVVGPASARVALGGAR